MRALRRKLATPASPSATQNAELVAELAPIVEELSGRVEFFRTQIQATSLDYSNQYVDPTAGSYYLTFNPAWDMTMDVTAGESGILSVTISGLTGGTYGTYGRFVFLVDGAVAEDAYSFLVSGSEHVRGSTSRTRVIGVEPFSTVTVTTRRMIASNGTGIVPFARPALVVTRFL